MLSMLISFISVILVAIVSHTPSLLPESTTKSADVVSIDQKNVKGSEVYFGAKKNTSLANGNHGVTGEQTMSTQTLGTVGENKLYLDGTWNINPEYAENKGTASIVFKYNAKNVYMVASSDEGIDVEVYRDADAPKTIHIKENQLYTLIEGADYGQHVMMIKIPKAGLKAFTFTFG